MNPQQPQWQYKPSQPAAHAQDYHGAAPAVQPATPASNPDNSFSWIAPEFMEHQRNVIWYAGVIAVVLLLSAATYLLTKDKFTVGVIGVLGAIVMFYSFRKPHELNCEVSGQGLRIGKDLYPFGKFRSFGIIREGLVPSLELRPTKKLMPAVTVHFDAKDEQQITSIIGSFLPYEEMKMAGIDKLSHRLKI